MEGETKTARIDQKLTNFFISLFFSPKFRIKGNQKHQFLKGDSIKQAHIRLFASFTRKQLLEFFWKKWSSEGINSTLTSRSTFKASFSLWFWELKKIILSF